MNGSDSAVSDTLSPASSASSNPSRNESVGHVAVNTGRGWTWSTEESNILQRLVKEQGKLRDWQSVAQKLAIDYPLSNAPARSANRCKSYFNKWCTKGGGRQHRVAQPNQSVAWSPEDDRKLKGAIMIARDRASQSGTSRRLTPDDWLWISQQLSSQRTIGACRNRTRELGWYNKDCGKVQSPLGRAQVARAPLETRSVAAALKAPQESVQTLPTVLSASASISHLAQPFSFGDDTSLLALYRQLGPMHKAISRRMVPQRHKHEVRERLEYLLGGYGVEAPRLFF